jgi:hypothetical protein
MAQQYRHIIPCNPEHLICNHNLFDVHPFELDGQGIDVLTAVVNSTLVANFKTFYGRYAGTEGNLKTEVVDVNLLEIPDPRNAPKGVAKKLNDAFARLCSRTTGAMVEEAFMECRSFDRIKKLAHKPVELPNELKMADRRNLDLAVFELLGVAKPSEREKLVDELYYETANHFRQIRIVEVQKQEQRAKAEGREFRTDELAADLWDSLQEDEKQPLAAWMAKQVPGGLTVNIPDGDARLPDASDFLDANTVFFRAPGSDKTSFATLKLPTRTHAELVHFASQQKICGQVALPKPENAARELLTDATARVNVLAAKADELARSRTSDERKAMDLARLLLHWMINGTPRRERKQSSEENSVN